MGARTRRVAKVGQKARKEQARRARKIAAFPNDFAFRVPREHAIKRREDTINARTHLGRYMV